MSARGLAALRQFAKRPPPAERCHFCALRLNAAHQHLIDPAAHALVCACDPCAVLFTSTGETKFRRVPRLVRELPDFDLPEWQWSAFGIPIAMVFFFYSTAAQKMIALYPSPAGPAESPLDLREWEDLAAANPGLRRMLPDVEALLVNRVADARDYFLAPIDRCYELTGLIRRHWSGFSGGGEAWREIERFFAALRREAVAFSVRENA